MTHLAALRGRPWRVILRGRRSARVSTQPPHTSSIWTRTITRGAAEFGSVRDVPPCHQSSSSMPLDTLGKTVRKLSNTAEEKTTVRGSCFCGGVKFSVSTSPPPNKPTYCHCESCRRAHSAPLYQIVYVPEEAFTLSAGEDLVQAFQKTEGAPIRSFCKNCGSRIHNRLPKKPEMGIGFFPALLEESMQHDLPHVFRPIQHYLSHEAVMNLEQLADDLPRN
mmetsp:Transcript_6483/g.12858  ORF Transcript_6483/g.12858 Transcript_6483/m.12858 type:complete len:221 (-) Transcript_6483:347-1009(-)